MPLIEMNLEDKCIINLCVPVVGEKPEELERIALSKLENLIAIF